MTVLRWDYGTTAPLNDFDVLLVKAIDTERPCMTLTADIYMRAEDPYGRRHVSDLIETFFHSGSGYWTLYGAVRERARAMPANPTVALAFVAIARAEPLLPPARRHAASVLAFLSGDVRTQVCRALVGAGLVRWNDDHELSLTEAGRQIAAALRGDAGASAAEDWCDLPPSPSAADPSPAAPTEEFREEEQVIPFAAPEDYLDPPEEDDEELPERPISWSQAVQEYGLDTRRTVKAPPQPAEQPKPAPTLGKPAEPPPRRKPVVNREPPGVPRY